MQFKAEFFQDLVEIMASMDRLGLFYVVQKDYEDRDKWFGFKKEKKVVWYVKVIRYSEEETTDGEETKDLQGRHGEDSPNTEATGGEETR